MVLPFVFAARLVLELLPQLLSFFLAPHGVAAEKNAEFALGVIGGCAAKAFFKRLRQSRRKRGKSHYLLP